MPFKQMTTPKYPRRQWSLVGRPGDGKTLFSTQMSGPLLAIDADHRYTEVLRYAQTAVNRFEDPADNVLVSRIHQQLLENMPDEKIGTIVVDSLTAIIAPLVSRAMMDNESGANKNKAAAFVTKAVGMRLLQDAVTMWGTDVLWIFHLQDGRDNNAREVVTQTIPKTELARLQRSLNARLRIVRQSERRGITVEWCRIGKAGVTLWDDSGYWLEMPEKLEQAMYDGLTAEPITSIPTSFSTAKEAITWAVGRNDFESYEAAQKTYNQVKAENNPATPQDMWDLWIAHVTNPEGLTTEEETF